MRLTGLVLPYIPGCLAHGEALALLLEDARFHRAMACLCDLVSQQMGDAGFALESWRPLHTVDPGQRRLGFAAGMREACEISPPHPLELQVSAWLGSEGGASISLRVTRLAQDRPMVVGLLVVFTRHTVPEEGSQERLAPGQGSVMVFVEARAQGQVVKAVRAGEGFYSLSGWVPAAMAFLLERLNQG